MASTSWREVLEVESMMVWPSCPAPTCPASEDRRESADRGGRSATDVTSGGGRTSVARLRRQAGDAILDRPESRLRARSESELEQDAADVGARRALADHELVRDLLVRVAEADQGEHLTFPR